MVGSTNISDLADIKRFFFRCLGGCGYQYDGEQRERDNVNDVGVRDCRIPNGAEVGLVCPVSIRIVVVLPTPLGLRNPKISP